MTTQLNNQMSQLMATTANDDPNEYPNEVVIPDDENTSVSPSVTPPTPAELSVTEDEDDKALKDFEKNINKYPNEVRIPDSDEPEQSYNTAEDASEEDSKRDFWETLGDETLQLGGYAAAGGVEGVHRGTAGLVYSLPALLDAVDYPREWINEQMAYQWRYNKKKFTNSMNNRIFLESMVEGPETSEGEMGVLDALSELIWQKEYAYKSQENFIKDYTDYMKKEDKHTGWIDKTLYWGAGFVGELAVLPIGGKRIAQAYAHSPQLKKRFVMSEFDKVSKGTKDIVDIKNDQVRIAVRKMVFSDVRTIPAHLLRVRDHVYAVGKGFGMHMKDASSYGIAAGIATQIGYKALQQFDAIDDETAEAQAPLFGLVGMFTGLGPAGKLAKLPFTMVGKTPIGPRPRPGGDLLRVSDITRSVFKVRNLVGASIAKRANNVALYNYHRLRYAGADRDEAIRMSAMSDITEKFISENVTRQAINDGTTFLSMMDNLVQRHPEYAEYIVAARERAMMLEKNFSDIFKKDPVQSRKLKGAFETELRKSQQIEKTFSEDEIKTIVNDFADGDAQMFLDQMFMLDFISTMRNMSMDKARMTTLSTKETIDLFSEGAMYNEAMQGQVQVLRAAIKSLQSTPKLSDASNSFLDQATQIYNKYDTDTQTAGTILKNNFDEAIRTSEDLNDKKFIDTISEMGQINRFKKVNPKNPTKAENEFFEARVIDVENLRRRKMDEFSKEYDKLYANKEGELYEFDASDLMGELSLIKTENLSEHTLGKLGVSVTESTLSPLQQFQGKLRVNGIQARFDLDSLIFDNVDKVETVAAMLDSQIKGTYNLIETADPNFFFQNTTIKNLNSDEVLSPIQRVIQERPANFKQKLIEAINQQVNDIGKIDTSLSLNAPEIDKALNLFSKPKITIEDAHSIAKGLFEKTRGKKTSMYANQNRQLNDLGYTFIDAIGKGIKQINDEGVNVIPELKKLSSEYKKKIIDVYGSNIGAQLLDYRKVGRQTSGSPEWNRLFDGFFLDKKTSVTVEQFNQMFPRGSKERKQAVEALKYSLAKHIERGESLTKLGTQGNNFLDNFRTILGPKYHKELRNLHDHKIVNIDEQKKGILGPTKEKFKNAFEALTQDTQDKLTKSVLGRVIKQGTEVDPSQLIDMIFSGSSGRRIGINENIDTGSVMLKEDMENILKPKESWSGVDTTQIGPWGDTGISKVQAMQLPHTKLQINGDTLSVILSEAPQLREPLQDMVIHRILENSFTMTDKRFFDKLTGRISLQEHLNIAEFGNIMKNNSDELIELFGPEKMKALETIFESGIVSQGKNMQLKLAGMASEPTTQSIASRVFAIQRDVVGKPYVATEQTVMAYQREKASFLKSIVFDKDFAELIGQSALRGSIRPNLMTKYVQYLRTVYGDAAIDNDDIVELEERLNNEFESYGGVENIEEIGIGDRFKRMFTGKGFFTSPEDDDRPILFEATAPAAFLGAVIDTPEKKKALIEAGEFSKLRGKRRAYEERREKIGKDVFKYEGNLH